MQTLGLAGGTFVFLGFGDETDDGAGDSDGDSFEDFFEVSRHGDSKLRWGTSVSWLDPIGQTQKAR